MENVIICNRVKNTKYFTSYRFKNWLKKEYLFLLRYIKKDTKLLDVGSMDGRIGFMMTDDLKITFNELHLTDYQKSYVEDIEGKIADSEKCMIFCKQEDVMCLTYDKNYFDYVTAFGGVLSLLYSKNYGGTPDKFDKKISRREMITQSATSCFSVLKTGGFFLLQIEKKDFLIVKEALSRFGGKLEEKMEIREDYFMCCFSKENLNE